MPDLSGWISFFMKKFQKVFDLSRPQIEALVDDWIIGANAERNRAIIKDRLIDGIPYEELGFRYNLATQSIKTIVAKGLQRMIRGL